MREDDHWRLKNKNKHLLKFSIVQKYIMLNFYAMENFILASSIFYETFPDEHHCCSGAVVTNHLNTVRQVLVCTGGNPWPSSLSVFSAACVEAGWRAMLWWGEWFWLLSDILSFVPPQLRLWYKKTWKIIYQNMVTLCNTIKLFHSGNDNSIVT